MFLPRTIHRLPVEKRWVDDLSFVTGLPWKLNKEHEAGEDVVLDATPPAPSMEPTITSMPPTVTSEPTVRKFYVKVADLDPKSGCMGFAEGCAGCTAIILGKTRAGIAMLAD